jgi:hypothetical protein
MDCRKITEERGDPGALTIKVKEASMAVPITIINADESETEYASVDAMPEGPLKEEIKKVVARNPRATRIRKVVR